VVVTSTSDERSLVDIRVGDVNGHEVLTLEHVTLAPAPIPSNAPTARPSFYKVEWQDVPLPPPVPSNEDDADVERTFTRLAQENGVDRYAALKAPLQAWATDFARAALVSLGAFDKGGRLTPETVNAARAAIVPEQQRLYDHLVTWFANDNVWGTDDPDESARERQLVSSFPEFEAELHLLGRCGPHLAEVFRGEVRPLDVLFGDTALLTRLYQQSPFSRCFNTLASDVIAQRARRSTRTVRILEIGAGTGGTTTWVLPRLDARRTHYVFSDVSQAFLARATETFADYRFVEYRLFDVERRGAPQGLEPGTFDIVLAANVLHATAEIKAAVEHARELLAPDGLLVLVEGTEPQRWVDLTFGMTDGWWRFTGRDPRRTYPLLSADAWRSLLAEVGLHATLVPEDGATGEVVITASVDATPLAHDDRRIWVVVGGATQLANAVVEELAAQGDQCVHIAGTGELSTVPAATVAASGIVLVANGTTDDNPVESAVTNCECLAELVRSVTRSSADSRPRLWAITTGAQAVESGSDARIDQAALWGLGPAAALELPDAWGGLIDVDPDGSPRKNAQAVVHELTTGGHDDRVVYRAGRRLVPRLVEHTPIAAPPFAAEGGSWLVTGGLGAIGSRTAEWLADHGVLHVVLLGRTGTRASEIDESPTMRVEFVERLRRRGIEVNVVDADLTDGSAVNATIARFGKDWPALEGVVHTAARFGSQPLAEMSRADFEAVLLPKAAGAWHLHRHAPATLRHFVMFSSTASLIGGVGQAHYAAANAVLDALAHARRFEGKPALSINWGLWSVMRGVSDESRRQYASIGFREMQPEAALAAMSHVFASVEVQTSIASMDWPRVRAAFRSRRPQPFLDRVGTVVTTAAAPRQTSLTAELMALDRRDRPALALSSVTAHIAAILRLQPSQVPPERGLFEMGMDSLMSIELRQRLEKDIGRSLPSTLTFNYGSARALADYLVGIIAGGAAADLVTPTPADPDDLEAMSEDELASALTRQLERLS
jgi:NAD(P)-dependent dehydrogenase (short-subunit alcohol dehydrogenase family)/SAM-dependent methyltransferase/acyl carrier protein